MFFLKLEDSIQKYTDNTDICTFTGYLLLALEDPLSTFLLLALEELKCMGYMRDSTFLGFMMGLAKDRRERRVDLKH